MNCNVNTSENFIKWMRPHLKKYYILKIEYLRSILQEIIPENISEELMKMVLGEDYTLYSKSELTEIMYKPMREYLKVRGKLLRPLLTCMCIEGYGKDLDVFKPIIAISEIIHSCSLILDDIADASLIRRGRPCAHRTYGIPRAANASSAMTFLTFRLLTSFRMPINIRTKLNLYELLLWEHYTTNIGSALDLGWSNEKYNNISENEYLTHIVYRSCSYTYRHAARLGATVAIAPDEDMPKIFQYCTYLGIAFQLIDDILNLKPELGSWGKTIAEDITEGKRSLLVLHCLEYATIKDKKRLLEILDGKINEQYILQEGIRILEKYGSFKYVRNKAEQYIQKSCSTINDTRLSDDYKLLFKDFAHYVTERKI